MNDVLSLETQPCFKQINKKLGRLSMAEHDKNTC